jgi:predicted NACHT family NTPase
LQDIQLRDVFLPQDVRENPPPVELPWDLKRKLAGAGKDDRETEIGPLPGKIAEQRLAWLRSTYTEQPRRPVLDVLREPESRRTVLLGDPGAGKSTLAKYLLLSILDPPREPGTADAQGWVAGFAGYLPLLIEIREFIGERSREKCETFLEFLDHLGRTQGYALEEQWLTKRLHNGPSLVLFDGLDEIFDAGDRERVMREIVGFCSDYPKASVVVTSRPVGYTDTILRSAGFRHFAIQDLDDGQVDRFVRGWFALTFPRRPEEGAPRIDRVLKACEQSRSIRLLAGNPMLLTIMAMIARQQELPRERARFYEYSADVLCYHWDVNRRLRDAGFTFEYVGLDDKKELLRRIAFCMQSAGHGLAGNFIHGDELQEEMEAYFTERYRVGPKEAKEVTLALIEQLHTRNYILCLYGPGLFGFVHRTLLEYFCAAELTRRVHEDPSYPIEMLINDIIAKHWQEAAWHEVIRLVCGMVGEAYAGKIIEYLTTEANSAWRTDPICQPARHLVFAAQCLAEVRNRYAIAQTCLILLQAIVGALGTRCSFRNMHVIAEELPKACEEVGTSWPGSEWLSTHLATFKGVDWFKAAYLKIAVSLLGPNNEIRLKLEVLSEKSDWATRALAIEMLAKGWQQDIGVREFIQERANKEENELVRKAALLWLAHT